MLKNYVSLRIAYAGALEWKDLERAVEIDKQLYDMEKKDPSIELEYLKWYDACAAQSQVQTADDAMAMLIKKHFAGKRATLDFCPVNEDVR